MGADRWPDVLARICEQVGAFCGDIQNYDPATGEASFVALHGWSDESIAAAVQHAHLNPMAPIALTTPLGEPVWFN